MSNTVFHKKLTELQKVLPFKFRVGSSNKAKTKFLVLAYIDARDCMDRLDQIFGQDCRQRSHKDIAGKSYCSLGIWNGDRRVRKEDVGEKSKVAQEKGEASDAFKRACVNWGLGRFLYTMPSMNISSQEHEANAYNMTKFVKEKYKDSLIERSKKYNAKIDEKSKYFDDEENETQPDDNTLSSTIDGFSK